MTVLIMIWSPCRELDLDSQPGGNWKRQRDVVREDVVTCHMYVTCVCDILPTFGRHSDPVEVTCEFLWHVGLPSSWQADHHDHRRTIGHIGGPRCTGRGGDRWTSTLTQLQCLTLQCLVTCMITCCIPGMRMETSGEYWKKKKEHFVAGS